MHASGRYDSFMQDVIGTIHEVSADLDTIFVGLRTALRS
jgi:hypothetical protein